MLIIKQDFAITIIELFQYYLSPSRIFIVEADKVRINEIISNLLKNAIQFTKEGNITIAVAIEKTHYNEIIISIKDTGTGIES